MKDWILQHKIAEHEACHAIVAQKMGLTVEWVQVNPGYDEGIEFAAAVKIPDETLDMDRDLKAVCVAMAAPSFLTSHESVPELWRYAQMEADLAYQLAGRQGIDGGEVYDEAAWLVTEHRAEIADLATRLCEEGKVVFQTA